MTHLRDFFGVEGDDLVDGKVEGLEGDALDDLLVEPYRLQDRPTPRNNTYYQ